MRETDSDLAALQAVLDRSMAGAGAHLREIFGADGDIGAGQPLAATELCDRLQGILEIHLATVTADGTPLVAPVDATLFRGNLWVGLPGASVRAGLVHRDPRGERGPYIDGPLALIVHGTVRQLGDDDPLLKEYDRLIEELYVQQYGPGWVEWNEQQRAKAPRPGVTGYIEPRAIFAKA